jgi:caa(3)-type oxidase subunit IV
MSEEHAEHAHPSYFKTYIILLILMFTSLIGSEIGAATEIQAITLIAAFGIAVVKAYLVAARFMHLDIEKRYVVYMLTTCLAFMGLFYAAISPDIQRHTGTNWVKPAWVEREASWNAGTWLDESGHGHHPGEENEEGAEHH